VIFSEEEGSHSQEEEGVESLCKHRQRLWRLQADMTYRQWSMTRDKPWRFGETLTRRERRGLCRRRRQWP